MDREIEDLQRKFGSERVTFSRGRGGFVMLSVKNAYAAAELTTHGAHLLGYTPAGAEPVIWMSEQSMFAPGEPIRGGIPICWPWFGAHSSDSRMPAHGFARRCDWKVVAVEALTDGDAVTMRLGTADVPAAMCAGAEFVLEFQVKIGAALECGLSMRNCGREALAVTAALHTYFRVGAADRIAVGGLEGTEYTDMLDRSVHREAAPVRIAAEVDRLYTGTDRTVEIVDPVLNRTIRVAKSGSCSTVVWNPWTAKSQRMPDFGDDEYRTMVCVETANAGNDRRVLPPGEAHLLGCRIWI